MSKTDRILVVDDSPDNLFLIQTILEDKGYDITLVEGGITALRKLEQEPPDLILLDVMMPEMDGYEVTRRIRQNPKLPYIPILLITAHNQLSVVTGLDAGADEFIRKPVNMDELMARVRSLLRLKHTMDERERLAKEQEDFVSRLTHDLRTPLVAADRMLNLFCQNAFGAISEPMAEAIKTMIQSNQSLLQTVNTLLEVYRHEAGRRPLNFTVFSLRDLVSEVVQALSPLANERELTLTAHPEDETDDYSVRGDRIELRRVLTNLIGNAIKFTETGGVEVDLAKVSPPETGQTQEQAVQRVEVEIRDTGQGISLEDQLTLFERFRTGKHKRSGSGLGLYLSQQIVLAHQGTISVKSEVGKGSVFTVSLPAL